MYYLFAKRYFIRLVPVLLLLSLLLVACGGDNTATSSVTNPLGQGAPGGTTPDSSGKLAPVVGANGQITVLAPTPTGTNMPGLFVWVNSNNIWISGANSQGTPFTSKNLGGKALTKVEPLAQATSPTLSPDSSQVVYAYSPEPQGTAGNIVIGQDIWIYDLKANSAKMVIKRDEPQTFLDEPIFSADGKFIYFSYRTPVRDQKNIVTGEKIGIDRFEVATAKREHLTEDARYPAPSPDGKSVVYVGTDASGGTYETTLKVLDIATKQSKTLLDRDSAFLGYYAPRYSPDGSLIAFSAVGGPDTMVPDPNAALPGQNVAPAPAPTPTKTGAGQNNGGLAMLGLLVPPETNNKAKAAHGVPFDVWTIKPDGSNVKRITTLFEDQPIPAWSKDGKQIAFLAGLGLYIVDADGKNLSKKADTGAHGGFDWRE